MTQTVRTPRLLHITTVPQSLFFLRGQPRFLAERGWDVHAASSPGDLLESFRRAENVAVHPIEMPRSITPLKDVLAVFRLWRLLRKLKPDIVDAHTPKGGLLGMLAARLAGTPVRIYHIHGLPFLTAKGVKRWLLRGTESISCALAHQVLCVSPSIRDLAVTEGLCNPAKAKVLLNGSINGVDAMHQFNPERFSKHDRDSIRANLNIPADAQVIGFVGRVTRDKGILELFGAWRCWRTEFPSAHILIVGPFDDEDPAVEAAFHALHRDPRAHVVLEWVDDPAPYYAAMDVLAFPSHREGFGLVALEASAMVLPVVGSDIPGCVDCVQTGTTGTLVQSGDERALRAAVMNYLRRPRLRMQHGKAGRARALRLFSRRRIWEAIYADYLHMMKSRGIRS